MKEEKKEWEVVVLGGINTDFFIQTPTLPKPGETVLGLHFYESSGGKGANQAVAVARLGVKVALLGKVGKDLRGEQALANLQKENVETSLIIQDKSANTGLALISIDQKGEKQIAVAAEANATLSIEDIKVAGSALQHSRIFLTQLEVPLPSVIFAIELASKAGACVVLDAAPAQVLPEFIYHFIDVIRLNSTEATVLTNIAVMDRPSATAAAKWFIQKGVKIAIVQAGSAGDILISADHEEIWLRRFSVKSIDSTGAGDAFVAAFAASLTQKKSIKEAALFSSAAAALSTTVMGAQAGLPQYDAVLHFIAAN